MIGRVFALAALAVGPLATVSTPQKGASEQVEWPYYGGDSAGTRYSTLTDIHKGNLERLGIAWQYTHFDKRMPQYSMTPGAFEATPLMINGVLYVSTPYNNIAALDAETGKELWHFDGEAYKLGPILANTLSMRAPAVFREGGKLRVMMNSRRKMFELDAETGKPVSTFGDNGVVSLVDGLQRMSDPYPIMQTSPPVVYRDVAIVGSRIADAHQLADPVGYVQAFNVRTGKRVWTFSVIPQSHNDPGAETWENDSWKNVGHGNVWAPMTLDEKRGLLYVPTSTPSSDYYGGERPGAGLFAESLVCMEAETGKIKWYFQTVHHGLWDWDNPAAPNLVTITVDAKKIDAVAQVTKQGFTYVFDRVTGKPVWPIVERPVPTDSDVPGEKPYPTQPFPTKPPAFAPQGVTLDDANNLTPEIKAMSQQVMKKYRLGPMFTPPSLEGTLQRPADTGAANWGGAAFDPEIGYLFVRASNTLISNRIGKNDGSNKYIAAPWSNAFVKEQKAITLPGGLPIISPPYASLVAIDLNKGEIAWKSPLGEGTRAMRENPLLKGVPLPDRLGSGMRGGAMVTKSGLVFIGGGDGYMYAFDEKTGKELWRGEIPWPTSAVPMTYRTRSGKQFIVIATGGGEQNALVAFALDAKGSPAN